MEVPNENSVFDILNHMVRPTNTRCRNTWKCDEININSGRMVRTREGFDYITNPKKLSLLSHVDIDAGHSVNTPYTIIYTVQPNYAPVTIVW